MVHTILQHPHRGQFLDDYRIFQLCVPHTVPSPGCLDTILLPSVSFCDTRCESSTLFRAYGLYASDLHFPSLWITRSAMSPPDARAVAPPIRNECNAYSWGLLPDFATTSLTARRAALYLTTLTLFHYGTKPTAGSGDVALHDNSSTTRATAPPFALTPDCGPVTSSRNERTICKTGHMTLSPSPQFWPTIVFVP